jgi:thiosulfate dehydrogenase [quinone] large subunit
MTLALLPLRVFLGVTFIYAGVDKLVDPAFLRATGPGSIGEQLAEFIKISPIAPLVAIFGQTFPVEIGLLIAIAEIAVGLGALTGLLFRPAAIGGFALSILFWLTASWATTPYYYGPDLPYALGWLTLALAGTGGRFTVETWLARRLDGDRTDEPASVERRAVLEAGIVGAAAIAVAALAGTVGASLLGRPKAAATGTASTAASAGRGAPSTQAAGASGGTAPVGANPTPAGGSGPLIAQLSQLTSGRAVAFDDPLTGDPGVLLKMPDGSIVAYDAVCTHAGCTVEYDRRSGFLLCPCHGAAFDPRNDAQAVAGPTRRPLPSIPIHVDTATGRITLSG